MSIIQYKKVLSIAEALLAKVDIPAETLAKYEELKLRLLGEEGEDFSLAPQQQSKEELELAKYQSTLDQEIVASYSSFLGTLVNLLQSCFAVSTKFGSLGNAEDYLLPFYQSFEERKQLLRNLVLESPLQPSNRLILSSKLKLVDAIGASFDEVIKKLGAVQETFSLRNGIEKQLEEKISQLEKDLSNALYSLDTSKKAMAQLEILKQRNTDLELKLESYSLDSTKAQMRITSELESTKHSLEEAKATIEALGKKSESLESERSQFCEAFLQLSERFRSQDESALDRADFPQIASFALSLVQKLGQDNKWFEEHLAEKEQVLGETQKNWMESQEDASAARHANNRLLQELEAISQGGKKAIDDLSELSEEYKELVEQGLGLKKVLLSC